MNDNSIIVKGMTVPVEILDIERTTRVHGRITQSMRIDESWPIGLAEITQRTSEVFDQFQCQQTRADSAWAVNKAGLDYLIENGRFMFRVVPTTAEKRQIAASHGAPQHD